MSLNLETLIDEHIEFIQYVKEKSPNTVKNRKWSLENFISSTGVSVVSDITSASLNRWVVAQRRTAAVQSRCITGRTINTRMSHMKSFLLWLDEQEIELSVKLSHIVRVDEVKPKQVYFTRDEVQKILAVSDTRESLMIHLLFDTLMRRAELASLHIDNIKGHKIEYIGKGNVRCVAYMSDHTAKLLTDWVDFYRIEGYIFPTANGHLDPTCLGRIIKGVCARAGLPQGHTHAFRHTGATDLELNGAPIDLISKLLNHTKIDTTRIYTHATEVNLEAMRGKFARSLA